MDKVKPYLPSIFYVIAIIIVWIVTYFLDYGPKPAVSIEKMTAFEQKAIDMLIEMNKLFISLSLLIIGGTLAFVIQKYQVSKLHSVGQQILVFLTIFSAGLAIYFGFVQYMKMEELLSSNKLPLHTDLIWIPVKYQYYSFLLSIMLCGLFGVNEVIPKGEDHN